MFDQSNQDDLNTLKTEVENNVVHYGTGTTEILNRLNTPELARTGPTVVKSKVSAAAIRTATTYQAYNRCNQDEQEWLRWMTGSNGFEEESLPATADLRLKLYAAGGADSDMIWASGDRAAMKVAMQAVFERAGSEAEGLFGTGTVISREDWFAARDNGVIV